MRWTKEEPNLPSNYTPDLVVKIIKEYLEVTKDDRKDILLYNYPMSDAPIGRDVKEGWFPRAADEI